MKTAKEWKEEVNRLVQDRKFKEALECYTKAIDLDKSDPVLYSNRSLMHYNLKEYNNAIVDANKALSLNPNHAKAYLRKGNALEELKRYEEALCIYQKGLEIDQNNTKLLEAYQKLENLINNEEEEEGKSEMKKEGKSKVKKEEKCAVKNEGKSLIEKYALNKNVRIYLERQIGDCLSLSGIIEEIKDGIIYFHDDENEFHILNVKNIIDIKLS